MESDNTGCLTKCPIPIDVVFGVESKTCIYSRMKTILTNFSLIVPFLDLFAALCGNGMLESMLEPHLRQAGADTMQVGVSFRIFGCCYMVGNVLFGAVSMIKRSCS